MRRSLRLAILLSPALMATTCIRYLSVDVEQGADATHPLSFVFADSGGAAPRIDTFTVTGCPETALRTRADLPVLWSIVREDGAAGVTRRIAYGQAPAGYAQKNAPEPLERGGCYAMHLQGLGSAPDTFPRIGGGRFRILPDGRVLQGTPGGWSSNPRAFRELNRASVGCARLYRRARSSADSAAIAGRAFPVMDTRLTCGWLNARWPDVMRNPRSGERNFATMAIYFTLFFGGFLSGV